MLDSLQIHLMKWIRAKGDWRVSNSLEEERVEEVAVGLEDCSIHSKDSIGVEPQAGVGGTKLTAVRVGILQVDPPPRLTLRDSLAFGPVTSDERVVQVAIGARSELAVLRLGVVE